MIDIRNIAIIAHVDHGKTTLVDAMLKQTHTFRDNEAEMSQTTILDSNDLERERGITILAKNTAVFYKGIKINIIDTPGHADFGGEVERVLNMADGALLVVDAAEGPLPQTKFVLKKALEYNLKIILVINKIDRKDARVAQIIKETEDVFLHVAKDEHQLRFPIVYAVGRDGKAWNKMPDSLESEGSLEPLFETILETVPNAVTAVDQPLQMLISTLDYDNYLGRLSIGKIHRGKMQKGQTIALVENDKSLGNFRIEKIYTNWGIKRIEATEAVCGDIVALAGIPQLKIGQTVTDPENLESLPAISVTPPTLKITIGPNTSPLAGREGKYTTSRQIRERLLKEKETNLGLKIEENPDGIDFLVSGRGELHLAILIENMRRESYELQVSKPQVIFQEENGQKTEPFEEVTIDIEQAFVGPVTSEMGSRKAQLLDMHSSDFGATRLIYKISQRNLLGARNSLLTSTKGTVLFNSTLSGYEPVGPTIDKLRNGVLIASELGKSLSYGLENAQDRGQMFIGPGVNVYEGMIVGENSRGEDIAVNVCKGKAMTNVRSNKEVGIQLIPPVTFSLEQWLDFIDDDELLEVTPKSLRGRKRYLSEVNRRRAARET